MNFKSKKVNVNKYSNFQLKENFKRSKNKNAKTNKSKDFLVTLKKLPHIYKFGSLYERHKKYKPKGL